MFTVYDSYIRLIKTNVQNTKYSSLANSYLNIKKQKTIKKFKCINNPCQRLQFNKKEDISDYTRLHNTISYHGNKY